MKQLTIYIFIFLFSIIDGLTQPIKCDRYTISNESNKLYITIAIPDKCTPAGARVEFVFADKTVRTSSIHQLHCKGFVKVPVTKQLHKKIIAGVDLLEIQCTTVTGITSIKSGTCDFANMITSIK